MQTSIDLASKLASFSEAWQPRTVSVFNGHDVMVAKLRGAYELVLLLAPPVLSEPAACLAVAAQTDAAVAGVTAAEASGRGGRELRSAIKRLPVPVPGTIAVAG